MMKRVALLVLLIVAQMSSAELFRRLAPPCADMALLPMTLAGITGDNICMTSEMAEMQLEDAMDAVQVIRTQLPAHTAAKDIVAEGPRLLHGSTVMGLPFEYLEPVTKPSQSDKQAAAAALNAARPRAERELRIATATAHAIAQVS